MNIKLKNENSNCFAIIETDSIVLNDTQDSIDLMANCRYQGAGAMIIKEENITPTFFDLKTGIAGEILQKFSNYNFKLAIVGNFLKYESKSLRDFIYESNKAGRINFVNSMDEAEHCLTKS